MKEHEGTRETAAEAAYWLLIEEMAKEEQVIRDEAAELIRYAKTYEAIEKSKIADSKRGAQKMLEDAWQHWQSGGIQEPDLQEKGEVREEEDRTEGCGLEDLIADPGSRPEGILITPEGNKMVVRKWTNLLSAVAQSVGQHGPTEVGPMRDRILEEKDWEKWSKTDRKNMDRIKRNDTIKLAFSKHGNGMILLQRAKRMAGKHPGGITNFRWRGRIW